MSLALALVYQMMDVLNPKLKKNLSPHLMLEGQKKPHLNEHYHNLNLLDKIDPSHFALLFEHYQKKDLSLLTKLCKQPSNRKLDEYLKTLTFKLLNKHYKTLPYTYLSSFRGEKILFLNSLELNLLVHLLGLYDLKLFLKSSIDQKLIGQIHEALCDHEKAFLAHVQREPDKVTFKKMPLDNWKKDQLSFDTLKYTRGLNRLAKTLALENCFVKEEIILRLPLSDKPTFLSLATPLDQSFHDDLYEGLIKALDWLEAHPLKPKTL